MIFVAQYERLAGEQPNIVDLLSMPEDIDFQPELLNLIVTTAEPSGT